MSRDKIISLEVYRRKLAAQKLANHLPILNVLSDDKFLNQLLLIDFFAELELFFRKIFLENAQGREDRYTAIPFLLGYKPEHLETLEYNALLILANLQKKTVQIDAKGKGYIDLAREFTGGSYRTNYEAWNAFEKRLIDTDVTILLKNLSKSKIRGAGGLVRDLYNSLDQAKDSTTAEIVLMDNARFLENEWLWFGEYVKIYSY
jgi:hypothetical protein